MHTIRNILVITQYSSSIRIKLP